MLTDAFFRVLCYHNVHLLHVCYNLLIRDVAKFVTSLSQILNTVAPTRRAWVVIMLSQNDEDKWATVRIPTELLDTLEAFVEQKKDEFGLPKYRSKSEAVAEAVKEFLKKHRA